MLKNLVYILQSENYYPGRFLKFSYTHLNWWKLENRQKIVWTMKARLIWLISAAFFWGVAVLEVYFFKGGWMIGLIFLIAMLPVIVILSLAVLSPFDLILKRMKINSAAQIISRSGVTVVGITGSYGKTSTKEILASVLREAFLVIRTPENVNTDIGIANFVIKNEDKFAKDAIFIVEMGAYQKGEIEKICKMTGPRYSILTGINESHLERFGSLEDIIQAKFELPKNTGRLSLLNFDDGNIKKNCSRFSIENSLDVSGLEATNVEQKKDFKGLRFEWQGKTFETCLLARHNIVLILLCAKLAEQLSVPLEKIQEGIRNIKSIKHRLEPIYNPATDIMVIDDSYNGNFDGIKSGIEILKNANGRKVVLTPGLVELGPKMEEVHIKMGELYAENIDLVLLIKNKMTDCIIKGLEKGDFKGYKIYETTKAAHDDLANVLKKGDTIIFQNDLTDNYF